MLIALPVLAYFLVARLFFLREKKQFADALIKTHLVFFAIVAGSTELLSLFRAVEFLYVSVLWSLVVLVLLLRLIVDARNGLGTAFPLMNSKGIDGTPHARTLRLIIGLILTCTLATALLYPPNNYDSMIYHMTRVAHWIHNQSVSFYLTSYPPQNYQMPLAEFAILHFQLLSGSDVFANCVQWIAFCVAISLAWALAAELGGDRPSQFASAIAAATLPMAILQSSSTQNDLTAASFILAFALFMLRLRHELHARNILFAATALGLALLTKGTSYIYCAAVGICLAVPVLLRGKSDFTALKKAVESLFLVVLLA
ncbi:MAG: glycosyltransferase family 39 protein, partial [Candidatus Binatia bacterium]